jgi:hypothetical protein
VGIGEEGIGCTELRDEEMAICRRIRGVFIPRIEESLFCA